MQIRQRRRISSWVILAVFVPMLLLTSFHRHHPMAEGQEECMECAHHVHHSSHVSAGGTTIDACLLCQLSSTPYTVSVTTETIDCQWSTVDYQPRNEALVCQTVLQRSSRAPPVA